MTIAKNKFYRNFVLPENVLLEEIHAKVENGITTIFVPKEKPTKTKDYSRTIKVEKLLGCMAWKLE